MNNTSTIFGIIIALVVGGAGGYFTAQKATAAITATQVGEMTKMMKEDGMSMEKMGTIMMRGGSLLEERGAKYNDQDMVMMGKDLSTNGKKHQEDGKSMMSGDMMGMTAGGNMAEMPGMKM